LINIETIVTGLLTDICFVFLGVLGVFLFNNLVFHSTLDIPQTSPQTQRRKRKFAHSSSSFSSPFSLKSAAEVCKMNSLAAAAFAHQLKGMRIEKLFHFSHHLSHFDRCYMLQALFARSDLALPCPACDRRESLWDGERGVRGS
jgi:hypothetical protein